MNREHTPVLEALAVLPRWHVVHWGTHESSTLLCLWVAGRETLVPVDGQQVTYDGIRRPVDDGQLIGLLREIQHEQDRETLRTAPAFAARRWLLERWAHTTTTGALGVWQFPRDGFIRWVHNGVLHIEAGDGTRHPTPTALRDVLMDLGWNPPNHTYDNCWLQPTDLVHAAELAVLTPMAAFGFDAPPEWQ